MKTIQNVISAILILCITSSFAQNIKVESFVLENGLTVYLSEDHTRPDVFGGVVVKAGGKDDPKGATGMAHYQEHMLFKGTETLGTTDWEKEKPHIDKIFELYDELGKTTDEEARKKIQMEINKESLESAKYAIPNELSNIIKSMGGTRLNAGTGPDQTVYYNAFPPNQINRWLDLYAHRFDKPVFRSFQAELEVVYEEKNMYQDQFFFPILEKFNYNFFKNHPYGQQTLIGTVEDLKNPSLSKMYEFYKTYYVANNMALVLVGDFNSKKIIPIIKEKFGKWRSGDLPKKIVYTEAPFNGREEIKVKMSPIGLGVLGFRTPGAGSKDEITLEVCNGILSNSSQTGLLDQLVLDNKIMAAQVFAMPYQDFGANMFLFVPKIFGQNLEDGEKLVLEQLERLKKGDFDDNMLDAIKNELYVNQKLSLESNEEKAVAILGLYSQGKSPEYINKLPDLIKSVTKEDVLRVANQYFGDNYLAFLSKMGFPKKAKIDKPGFEALKVNTNAKSIYAEQIEKIDASELNADFVDFKDVTSISQKGGELLFTENKINDIFEIKMQFGIGEHEMPILKYAAQMINYAAYDTLSVADVKKQFALLGCNYYFSSDDNYVYANLEGMEANYEEAVQLFTKLIYNPVLKQEKIQNIIEEEKASRKMEASQPDNVASALFQYVVRKDKSRYLDRLSMKEIKALQAKDLVTAFKDATTNYYTEVHIVAQSKDDKISKKALSLFQIDNDRKPTNSPVMVDIEKYNENTVYFVHKKKALQSKVFFFANGKPFDYKDKPYIDAFNMYFGGGFSGLVLQEVREYRSLAYSAGAFFQMPKVKGRDINFIGYVGTQADKTMEALQVFDTLIRHMPEKIERTPMIKNYLSQSEFSNQPSFRNLSSTLKKWEQMGYTEDPAIYNLPVYKQLTFDDITHFYKKNLKEKAIVTVIVSNKKRVKLKELEKYGKVIVVKEKELFKK